MHGYDTPIARQVSNEAHERARKNPVTRQAVQAVCDMARSRPEGFTSLDVGAVLERLFPRTKWVPGTVSARIDDARKQLAKEGYELRNVRAENRRQVMVAVRTPAGAQAGLFGEVA